MEIKIQTLFFLILLLLVFSTDCFSQNTDADAKGIRTVYLIRHGEYDQADTSDSDIGKKLTPLGIAQARLVSARLKEMPVEFTSLTSSTMTRARETAMVINEEFPMLALIQDSLICECTPPSWRKELMAGVDTTEREICIANIELAFNKYFIPSTDEDARHDLIICHGNVIRYFVTKVLNVNALSWLEMSITNCSLTIIRILPDGRKKLDTFSDYGHIPENMRTFTGGENEMKKLVVPKD